MDQKESQLRELLRDTGFALLHDAPKESHDLKTLIDRTRAVLDLIDGARKNLEEERARLEVA